MLEDGYSLRIVASQRDQNYISLSMIQGGGSVDGRLGFVRRPRVEAIDLLTIEACEFVGDICSPKDLFFSFHSCGEVFLFISLSRPTALDSVRSAKCYDGNTEHSRLNDV